EDDGALERRQEEPVRLGFDGGAGLAALELRQEERRVAQRLAIVERGDEARDAAEIAEIGERKARGAAEDTVRGRGRSSERVGGLVDPEIAEGAGDLRRRLRVVVGEGVEERAARPLEGRER